MNQWSTTDGWEWAHSFRTGKTYKRRIGEYYWTECKEDELWWLGGDKLKITIPTRKKALTNHS